MNEKNVAIKATKKKEARSSVRDFYQRSNNINGGAPTVALRVALTRTTGLDFEHTEANAKI